MTSGYDPDKRKLLSALSHGSIFFTVAIAAIGVPIAILFVSDDPVVKDNAREALNFHLNLFVYYIVFGILAFLLIGIPLLWILGIVNFVMPIVAIVKVFSNPDQVFKYPFLIRVV